MARELLAGEHEVSVAHKRIMGRGAHAFVFLDDFYGCFKMVCFGLGLGLLLHGGGLREEEAQGGGYHSRD